MEIFRNSLPVVKFNHPAPSTIVSGVTWERDGAVGQASPTANGTFTTATLPFQVYDGVVKVSWTFAIQAAGGGTFTVDEYYDVVTPLVPMPDVQAIVDDEEYSLEDYVKIESNVRNIIQAHTGQTFGISHETKTVYGRGDTTLPLPERLISLDDITGFAYDKRFLTTKGDGWYLEIGPMIVPEIRADYMGVNTSTVPITRPYFNSKMFHKNVPFTVRGKWGWLSVPQPVVEAARLLINDYSGDSLYRDRYLVSMTAADWRIQFANGAFAQTGNVRADQLLSPFVVQRGWAVI